MKSLLYDVAVIGAGTAGSTSAACLARAGLTVMLVDAGGSSTPHHGEFLSPDARARIECLGLLPAGWEQNHLQVNEFLSSWSDAAVVPRNSLFDPRAHALILDRARFDSELTAAAMTRGSHLMRSCRVRRIVRGQRQWALEVASAHDCSTVRARVVLACTGRSASCLAGIPGKRTRLDRLICLGAHVRNYRGDPSPSVESYERGWVYSAGLRSGGLVINVCTERESADRARDLMLREMANCPIATSRLIRCETRSVEDIEFFFTDASSGFTRPAAGAGWCLVGDRAQSVDPLSASGIANAIHQARLVSDCILRSNAVHNADFSSYANFLDGSYGEYLHARRACYALERRWSTPFWERRH